MVNAGHSRMESGSRQLQKGLNEGAAKLRAALWLEEQTGIPLTGTSDTTRAALASNLGKAWVALLAEHSTSPRPGTVVRSDDPRNVLLHELTRAADGAGRIAVGAAQARHEVSSILEDPVGRRALNRLMITPETVRDHPELRQSFAAYISPDGHRSRIDLTQVDRIYSAAAMDQVETLRRRTNEFLGDFEGIHVTARISGENAESADIRALIRSDQVQSWYVVPVGVFLVLILTLRDPLACLNLVATMVLTYAFALGTTHLLFVTILGAAGIDWKVPYFLFVLLVAVGVDYNVFLMARLREESFRQELGAAIVRAVGQTGGLISSAAAITACSFASFLFSPLSSLRQLGFALVVGITIDALIVRPLLVPCGHWLMKRSGEWRKRSIPIMARAAARRLPEAQPRRDAATISVTPNDRLRMTQGRRRDPSRVRRRDGGWPSSKLMSPSFRSRSCRCGKTRLQGQQAHSISCDSLVGFGDGDFRQNELGPRAGDDGRSAAAAADAALTSEPVGDVHGQRQAEHRDRRAGHAGLVREDDRHVEVESDRGRDRGCHRSHVAEEAMLAAAMAAGEFGPGGRDHSQFDAAAVVIPDPAVHHIGTDRQTDPAPRRADHQWRPARAKAERLPENQVPLSVNMDRPLGQAEGQCIVEVPAVALDEPGGNSHPPLAAAMRQMPQGRPVRSLGVGPEVRQQTITCVEHLRQDRELSPRPVGLAQEIVSDLEVGGSLRQLGRHLHRSDHDLHGDITPVRVVAITPAHGRTAAVMPGLATASVNKNGAGR